jgi:glucosamine--fructose-6-phosphate aminotransferase (isomerizing)
LFTTQTVRHATFLEGALDVTSYMHSEDIIAGELEHNPSPLIDENVLTSIIMTQDLLYPKVQSAFE